MIKEFYEKLQEKLRGIYPQNRQFKPLNLGKAVVAVLIGACLITGLSSIPVVQNSISIGRYNMTMVEAKSKKRDTKKPVFKNFGKKTITIEKGSTIKLPKVKAKDNVDGNITSKIKITVKLGKKRYKTLEKSIKNGKKIKPTKAGKYAITYTVKDNAGNKAKKVKYLIVEEKAAAYNNTTEAATTEEFITEATTEAITENPVTEIPTPENPSDKEYVADLSKYADIEQVTVNGRTYNVATNLKTDLIDTINGNFYSLKTSNYDDYDYYYNIGIGKNSKLNNLNPRDIVLYFFGDVSLEINEVDYTKNIIFYPKPNMHETMYSLYLLVADLDGNLEKICEGEISYGEYDNIYNRFIGYESDYRKLSIDTENELLMVPSPVQDTYEVDEEIKLKLEKK